MLPIDAGVVILYELEGVDISGGGAELIRTAVKAQLSFNGDPLYSPRSAATLHAPNR